MSLPGVWLTLREHFALVLLDMLVKMILPKNKAGENTIFVGTKQKTFIIFLCFRVGNSRRGTYVFV